MGLQNQPKSHSYLKLRKSDCLDLINTGPQTKHHGNTGYNVLLIVRFTRIDGISACEKWADCSEWWTWVKLWQLRIGQQIVTICSGHSMVEKWERLCYISRGYRHLYLPSGCPQSFISHRNVIEQMDCERNIFGSMVKLYYSNHLSYNQAELYCKI